MTAYERFIEALEEHACDVDPTDRADDAMAQCPVHTDDTASLHVTGIEGQVLVYCHAGCDTGEILTELGLTKRDLFDDGKGATYTYDDGRKVHRSPDKKFHQSGQKGKVASLYRLGKVKEAVELGLPVYLVEGEKDVHSLEKHGYVATTAPMGSNNFRKVDVKPLTGAVVVAVRDNDEAGEKWAGQVWNALSPLAESVEFKVAAEGKDVTDHLMAGLPVEKLLPALEIDTSRPPVSVGDDTFALRWLKAELGRGGLSGVLRRGEALVYTPVLGEDGYVSPKDHRDNAGPAQVRRISELQIAARIDHEYQVMSGGTQPKPILFPQTIANRAVANVDLLPNVRDLDGVTHTPVVRPDWTILTEPGYDEGSRLLYLPDPSLSVPEVSASPSRDEVKRAGNLLLYMVSGFPFVTNHDRANYLGALLTPLLRAVAPPPYKLFVITAPQKGSGKSLLGKTLRKLHGGVFKSEFPSEDAEVRKFITATLDVTTAPVVQFDNVTGVLKSSTLDGLLTSAEWSDRPLGRTDMVTLPNDRFWVVTGNNIHIGGDLERRTLWCSIDADMEHPEQRKASEFAIPDLDGWVDEHRGDLLWALLTLIRSWVVAGRPLGEAPESTEFGRWIAVLRGILANAEFGRDSADKPLVGVVGHEDSAPKQVDPDAEEWTAFLAAARRTFGSEPWTARELLDRVGWCPDCDNEGEDHCCGFPDDALPGDIHDRFLRSPSVGVATLGKWLSFRDKRWAGGLSVQGTPGGNRSRRWTVVAKGDTK
ncbi:hypothetical protein [Nocardioides sp.]|uniref:hypothetical protein n=1 Tax=Nocardioides sp. TaxID=35761 RepID=UPI003561F721